MDEEFWFSTRDHVISLELTVDREGLYWHEFDRTVKAEDGPLGTAFDDVIGFAITAMHRTPRNESRCLIFYNQEGKELYGLTGNSIEMLAALAAVDERSLLPDYARELIKDWAGGWMNGTPVKPRQVIRPSSSIKPEHRQGEDYFIMSRSSYLNKKLFDTPKRETAPLIGAILEA
ncbi:hypothetical protein ACFL1B_03940 [Nanoarchaeota archaeon]